MDCLKKLANLKKEDDSMDEKMLHRLKNFVVMGQTEISQADRTLFEDLGLTVYCLNDVYQKGLE